MNLRLGFTSTSIDATINPDFSQVESDASQVTQNERFALFYAEKRPFFLEGIELFATPSQLVYTRQIVNPIAGAKFTGKVGSVGIAYLAARDDGPSGRAWFNVARVRKDLGKNSLAGFTYTDRTSAAGSNRVAAADARVVFAKLYYVQGQIGRSWTTDRGASSDSPVWLAEFDRTGRAWGFNYRLSAFGPSFSAQSGYVPRNNIVDGHASNRFSLYGRRGALLEQFTVFFGPSRVWRYGWFLGAAPLEGSDSANLNFQMRGGWTARMTVHRDFVKFEPASYAGYQIARANGTIDPFRPDRGLSGMFGTAISVTSPALQRINWQVEVQRNEVAIFPEASAGRETRLTGTLGLRPTGSIRIEATTRLSSISRKRDGSEFARTVIPAAQGRIPAEAGAVLQGDRGVPKRTKRGACRRADRGPDPRWRDRRGGDSIPGPAVRLPRVVRTDARDRGVLRIRQLARSQPALEGRRTLRRASDGFFVKLAYQFRR